MEKDWTAYGGDSNGTDAACSASITASLAETGGTARRETVSSYYVSTPQASNTAATNYGYWQPYETTGYNRLDAVQRQETWDSQQSAIAAVVEYQYDNPYANGNRTMEMHWDNTKPGAGSPPALGTLTTSNSQVLTRANNGFGSLTDIYSPEVRTHVTYGPHPSDPDNPGPYPTGIDYAYGSPFQRSWTYSWGNYYRGALASKTDDNNSIT